MLELPEVTLLCIDTRTPALALGAMARCMAQLRFARCVFLTQGRAAGVPEGIEAFDIGPIESAAAYSDYMLRQLLPWVPTRHVLVVQWDGFVSDAGRWDPAFLEVDYLGAPWGRPGPGQAVGNGGFSLRSRRLLQALRDPELAAQCHHPEDVCIARTLRPALEQRHGIVFGSVALARRFAYENERPDGPTFGFHGMFNLPRALGPQRFGEMLAQLPDAVVAGRDGFKTVRALLRAGERGLAGELMARRRALGHDDLRLRWLQWRSALGAWAGG